MLVIHHLLCVIFILPFGSTKPCCVKPSKRHRQKRYSEDDICFGTNGTIVNVDTCPKNLCDFRRRSQRKNCDSLQSCRNESLVYHCVRFEDSIIEVCAPEGTIRGTFYGVLQLHSKILHKQKKKMRGDSVVPSMK